MEIIAKIKSEVGKVISGQEELIDYSIISLMAGGHVLLEGVPGLAKTLLVKALSKAVAIDFKRIQFTPDLMPADITGTKIFNMQTRDFELRKGPIFTNLLLADEINRTPPKTQAGLLEAMAENTVTIEGEMLELDMPYIVFATQNPLEYEGTYPLPEALIDRFLIKITIDYPNFDEEREMLKKHHQGQEMNSLDMLDIQPVCTKEEILECQKAVQNVAVDEMLMNYILHIVRETRNHPMLDIGSSPRGAIALLKCAKAYAVFMGRDYVIPEDIKAMTIPTLRHRIILKPEVELDGLKAEYLLENILTKIKVPR